MSVPQSPPRDAAIRWIAVAAAVLAGVLLFGFMFGFDLPLAKAAFWVTPKNDMAAMTTGYEALLREPWGFPPTMTTLLVWPTPVSIVFTDSIPWLSLLLKASGIGALFNPLGVFLLLSYVLQPLAMAYLLRASGVARPLTLLAGGLLALMIPAWIIRQFGHIALSGHWLLILGLGLAVEIARQGLTWRRTAAFAALAALAVGVHAYHLVPIAVGVAAALTSTLLQRGPRVLPRVLLSGLAITAAVLLAALTLGYGAGRGLSGGGGALGYYSMNVLGPILPQASGLLGQNWTGTWYPGVIDPNGGQMFEGFNYLGAGVLALLLAAAVLTALAWISGARPTRTQVLRFAPLTVAAAALAVIAVGPTAYVGTHLLFDLPKPKGSIGDWLGFFRCHGRFFWASAYLLLAAAVTQVDRLAPVRWRAGLLAAAVVLQALDTSPLRAGVRATFQSPAIAYAPASLAAAPQIRGRPFVFAPNYFCTPDGIDMATISQLSLIAVRTGGSSDSVSTARSQRAGCEVAPDLLATARPGDRRITVVLNQGRSSGGLFSQFAARRDCHVFLRGLLCGADLDGVAGLAAAPPGLFAASSDRPLAVFPADNFRKPAILKSGWSAGEQNGLWSDGHQAVIEIPAARLPDGPFTLELTLLGYGLPPRSSQDIGVMIDGRKVADWQVEVGGWRPYSLVVTPDQRRLGQPLTVTFLIPGAQQPRKDARLLGVGVKRVAVMAPANGFQSAAPGPANTQ